MRVLITGGVRKELFGIMCNLSTVLLNAMRVPYCENYGVFFIVEKNNGPLNIMKVLYFITGFFRNLTQMIHKVITPTTTYHQSIFCIVALSLEI